MDTRTYLHCFFASFFLSLFLSGLIRKWMSRKRKAARVCWGCVHTLFFGWSFLLLLFLRLCVRRRFGRSREFFSRFVGSSLFRALLFELFLLGFVAIFTFVAVYVRVKCTAIHFMFWLSQTKYVCWRSSHEVLYFFQFIMCLCSSLFSFYY